MTAFDIDRGWALSAQVSLRPEPFGALVYDFTTRRLSFLKTRKLLALVRSLEGHQTAREACDALGLDAGERNAYEHALATLADSGTIVDRSDR